MIHRIDFVNATASRKVVAPIRRALLCLLDSAKSHQPAVIDVVIADNPRLQELNLQHRQIDAPTDVLSFPSPPNPAGHLGDVVLSWDFASEQARLRKVTAAEEAAMLAVHGALHLLGMDDQTDAERDLMVERQNQVMVMAGLPTDSHWSSLPHESGVLG